MSDQAEPRDPLSKMQELFCQFYAAGDTGEMAAFKAGYSEHTARVQASQLLSRLNIKRRVDELLEAHSNKVGITAEKILRRLDGLGGIDIGLAYDNNGNLLPVHEMPEEVRRCISSIKVFEEFEGVGKERMKVGEVREVKFYDKIKANELLGRNLKLFTDKVEHSGKVTLEDLVVGANQTDKKDEE